MPRYEFDGSFYFSNQNARDNFTADVASYIATNQGDFFGYEPVNRQQNDKAGVPFCKVEARFVDRARLNTLFNQIKAQAQSRNAVAPSTMWLKQVEDDGNVGDGTGADAPGWVNYPVT